VNLILCFIIFRLSDTKYKTPFNTTQISSESSGLKINSLNKTFWKHVLLNGNIKYYVLKWNLLKRKIGRLFKWNWIWNTGKSYFIQVCYMV